MKILGIGNAIVDVLCKVSDEFLVQKKNPLVMPPDYLKLPKPNDKSPNPEQLIEKETDIQEILKIDKATKKTSKNKFGKAEEFILENIKK